MIISLKDVNVLSFTITDEHTHDSKAARILLNKMKNDIIRIFWIMDMVQNIFTICSVPVL